MFRFLRKHKQDAHRETQKLQESFSLTKINSDGFPRKVHKFAIDTKENLLAIVTETGRVELFSDNDRRVLLKKLEAVHLLDVDGNYPCFTHNYRRSKTQSTSHCLCADSLLSGCGTWINKTKWDQLWPSSMSVEPFIDIGEFTESNQRTIRRLQVHQNVLIALLNKDLVVVVDMQTQELVKFISFKYDVQSVIFNSVSLICYFVSPQFVCALNLGNWNVSGNGQVSNCDFEDLMYYNKVKAKNRWLTIYCNGFPSEFSRDTCLMITDELENKVFSFADAVLDIQIIYDNQGNATILAVLLEHEFVAFDLSDPYFRRLSLPYLHCVDFSSVSTVKLLSDIHFPYDDTLKLRSNLFQSASETESNNDSYFFCTGHQNGDVVIWRAKKDRVDVLDILKTSDVLSVGDVYNNDEIMEPVELEDLPQDVVSIKEAGSSFNIEIDCEIKAPTQLFRNDDIAIKAGLYDDRCDDDGYTIEVIQASKEWTVVGLNCGIVLCYPLNGKGLQEGESAEFINANLANQGTINEKQTKISPIALKRIGMTPLRALLTISPQTPIRSLAISDNTHVIAVGCSTGIIIYNPIKETVVFKRNFLSLEDTKLVLSEEKPLTRLKSMKQSVRRTFRKKDASTRQKPMVDREVAFRDTNSPWTHGFKSLIFFEPTSDQTYLYAGTGNGILFMFGLKEDMCTLFKEIRLAHRAPVCSLSVLMDPVQTKLIVFTEEQIRSFNIDTLKSSNLSYKITAKCGVKIRRGIVVKRNDFPFLNIICNDGTSIAMSTKDKTSKISERFIDLSDNGAIRLSDLNENNLITVPNYGTIITLYKTT
ncbi:unnamed protein product [Bursaphelenchus xylophilus]|uniref:(pine wood nematode) hypothetical protein n=1 Tax=Bursaphelenchus xylophilus TaxID=6326 RepID=A0A7I8WIR3_BURXY|nr:unnamed protein product [Bursaphelenchus xylophilus]CAG9108856.1 unnamed protein product [Bursaphelenchus xylophilus]